MTKILILLVYIPVGLAVMSLAFSTALLATFAILLSRATDDAESCRKKLIREFRKHRPGNIDLPDGK